jgi:ankyrin repeat protein
VLDALDNKGHSLLFHASEKGNMSLVEELCKPSANVYITDLFGSTPLSVAVREGNISITKHHPNYSHS